ncbi:SusC/RagA family TonB-linked outer membrane protein [Nafulsella turpanensis]|uniref:SusC/RagA family TonB-linked outer membrane protein n=1 Tax=Nafulsella turpanensis TaxID=1265690 RepID=UPI0003453920|nr:SusC/RagA family TonB-linked outer membrane protein [Nafulsella turpanensis]
MLDEEGTDWFNEIFEVAPQQSHALNFSGGSEKTTYLIGGTYFQQEGIVGGDKSRFDRFTLRLNSTHQVRDWLEIGERLSYSHFSRNAIAENSEFGGLITSALALDPLTPVVYTDPTAYPPHLLAAINGFTPGEVPIGQLLVTDENGYYYGISNYVRGEFGNPLARIQNTKGGLNQNKVVGNVYAEITPFEGFEFTTRFGIDAAFQRERYWTPTFWYSSESLNTESGGSDFQNNWFSWQWENFATYTEQIDNHQLTFLLGSSAIENQWNFVGGTYSGLFKESDLFAYGAFTPNTNDDIISNGNSRSLLSVFGRLGYSYEERYLLNAIIRRDGSSVLAPGNKWGTFPSVSVGWNIHNEDFYEASGLSDIVNSVKLRASWGQNGNLGSVGIGAWMSRISAIQPGYYDSEGNYLVGAASFTIENPDLRWETSEQLDFGADIYMFSNRLSFTVDYFEKITRDLLTNALSFGPAGNDLPVLNGGTVENKGWEFELAYRSEAADAFQYEVGANFTTLENEVTFLEEAVPEIPGAGVGTGWVATYFSLGEPIWYFRGYETDGIFQNQAEIDAYIEANNLGDSYNPAPGDPIVIDTNGDEQISPQDVTNIGSPHPDFIFGTRLNLGYKGFDFLVFLQGQIGNEVLMGFNRTDRPTANRPAFFYTNRWTGEGSTNEFPAANTTSVYIYNSDLMVFDGSYARIRQLQLGYTLPETVFGSENVRNVRIYASLDNYFTFTNYPGLDPEVGQGNSVGIDRGAYPVPRKAMVGLQFSF